MMLKKILSAAVMISFFTAGIPAYAVEKKPANKYKRKTAKKHWRVSRYGTVNTTGWFAIKDYEKKRLFVLKKDLSISDSILSASGTGSDASTLIVVRSGERDQYSLINSGSVFDTCESFSRIGGGDDHKEGFFTYRNSDGVFLLAEGSRYGPFDSIEKCSFVRQSTSWYAYGTLDGQSILIINGVKYGPHDEIGGIAFSRDGGKFGFSYRISDKWRLFIRGSRYGYFDSPPPESIFLTEAGAYAYRYSSAGMNYISVNGILCGPFQSIENTYLSSDGNFCAFIFKKSLGYYVDYNGVVSGPYDSADSLIVDEAHKTHSFRYRAGSDYFIAHGDKNYGPFKTAGIPAITEHGSIEAMCEDSAGQVLISANTEIRIPHEVKNYFFTEKKSSFGYLYSSNGQIGLFFGGDDYGLYDEINSVDRNLHPNARAFTARRGLLSYLITIIGRSITIIPLPDNYIKGSAGLTEDGKTPLWTVKEKKGTALIIGSLKLGPFLDILLKRSRIFTGTDWMLLYENEGWFRVNHSGIDYELSKSCYSAKNYTELNFNVMNQSGWFASGITQDGHFLVVNGRLYGHDVFSIKYLQLEKTLLWLTLEGRSIYINRMKFK